LSTTYHWTVRFLGGGAGSVVKKKPPREWLTLKTGESERQILLRNWGHDGSLPNTNMTRLHLTQFIRHKALHGCGACLDGKVELAESETRQVFNWQSCVASKRVYQNNVAHVLARRSAL
jgi:hypothetical protein